MNCDPKALLAAAACYRCIPPQVMQATMISLLCQWANAEPVPPFECDPVYEDWKNRLIADGLWALVSQNTRDAVCEFCKDLRAAGIIDMMHAVNVVIPDDFDAMLYPLIYEVGNGNNPWLSNALSSLDFSINGLTGGGVDVVGYVETGFIPDNQPELSDASGGISVYSCTEGMVPEESISQCECGCTDTIVTGNAFELRTWDPLPIGNDAPFGVCWNLQAKPVFTDPAEIPAFVSMNRTAVNLLELYRANGLIPWGAPIATNIGDGTGEDQPGIEMYWMARNDDGVSADWTRKTVSFVAVHEGLTSVQANALYDAVVKMRTSFGGGLYP